MIVLVHMKIIIINYIICLLLWFISTCCINIIRLFKKLMPITALVYMKMNIVDYTIYFL